MSTFLEMQTDIADEIARSDLSSGGQIARKIKEAIRLRETERYWFNETDAYTFATVNGTDDYTLAADAGLSLSEFITIDAMEVQIGSEWRHMRRVDQAEMRDLKSSTSSGQPSDWCVFGSEVEIYPTPNDAFTIRVTGHFRLTELSADGDTNAWTTTAENMIRNDAKALVLADYVRNFDMAQASRQIADMYRDVLDKEHSRRTATGRIKPWC